MVATASGQQPAVGRRRVAKEVPRMAAQLQETLQRISGCTTMRAIGALHHDLGDNVGALRMEVAKAAQVALHILVLTGGLSTDMAAIGPELPLKTKAGLQKAISSPESFLNSLKRFASQAEKGAVPQHRLEAVRTFLESLQFTPGHGKVPRPAGGTGSTKGSQHAAQAPLQEWLMAAFRCADEAAKCEQRSAKESARGEEEQEGKAKDPMPKGSRGLQAANEKAEQKQQKQQEEEEKTEQEQEGCQEERKSHPMGDLGEEELQQSQEEGQNAEGHLKSEECRSDREVETSQQRLVSHMIGQDVPHCHEDGGKETLHAMGGVPELADRLQETWKSITCRSTIHALKALHDDLVATPAGKKSSDSSEKARQSRATATDVVQCILALLGVNRGEGASRAAPGVGKRPNKGTLLKALNAPGEFLASMLQFKVQVERAAVPEEHLKNARELSAKDGFVAHDTLPPLCAWLRAAVAFADAVAAEMKAGAAQKQSQVAPEVTEGEEDQGDRLDAALEATGDAGQEKDSIDVSEILADVEGGTTGEVDEEAEHVTEETAQKQSQAQKWEETSEVAGDFEERQDQADKLEVALEAPGEVAGEQEEAEKLEETSAVAAAEEQHQADKLEVASEAEKLEETSKVAGEVAEDQDQADKLEVASQAPKKSAEKLEESSEEAGELAEKGDQADKPEVASEASGEEAEGQDVEKLKETSDVTGEAVGDRDHVETADKLDSASDALGESAVKQDEAKKLKEEATVVEEQNEVDKPEGGMEAPVKLAVRHDEEEARRLEEAPEVTGEVAENQDEIDEVEVVSEAPGVAGEPDEEEREKLGEASEVKGKVAEDQDEADKAGVASEPRGKVAGEQDASEVTGAKEQDQADKSEVASEARGEVAGEQDEDEEEKLEEASEVTGELAEQQDEADKGEVSEEAQQEVAGEQYEADKLEAVSEVIGIVAEEQDQADKVEVALDARGEVVVEQDEEEAEKLEETSEVTGKFSKEQCEADNAEVASEARGEVTGEQDEEAEKLQGVSEVIGILSKKQGASEALGEVAGEQDEEEEEKLEEALEVTREVAEGQDEADKAAVASEARGEVAEEKLEEASEGTGKVAEEQDEADKLEVATVPPAVAGEQDEVETLEVASEVTGKGAEEQNQADRLEVDSEAPGEVAGEQDEAEKLKEAAQVVGGATTGQGLAKAEEKEDEQEDKLSETVARSLSEFELDAVYEALDTVGREVGHPSPPLSAEGMLEARSTSCWQCLPSVGTWHGETVRARCLDEEAAATLELTSRLASSPSAGQLGAEDGDVLTATLENCCSDRMGVELAEGPLEEEAADRHEEAWQPSATLECVSMLASWPSAGQLVTEDGEVLTATLEKGSSERKCMELAEGPPREEVEDNEEEAWLPSATLECTSMLVGSPSAEHLGAEVGEHVDMTLENSCMEPTGSELVEGLLEEEAEEMDGETHQPFRTSEGTIRLAGSPSAGQHGAEFGEHVTATLENSCSEGTSSELAAGPLEEEEEERDEEARQPSGTFEGTQQLAGSASAEQLSAEVGEHVIATLENSCSDGTGPELAEELLEEEAEERDEEARQPSRTCEGTRNLAGSPLAEQLSAEVGEHDTATLENSCSEGTGSELAEGPLEEEAEERDEETRQPSRTFEGTRRLAGSPSVEQLGAEFGEHDIARLESSCSEVTGSELAERVFEEEAEERDEEARQPSTTLECTGTLTGSPSAGQLGAEVGEHGIEMSESSNSECTGSELAEELAKKEAEETDEDVEHPDAALEHTKNKCTILELAEWVPAEEAKKMLELEKPRQLEEEAKEGEQEEKEQSERALRGDLLQHGVFWDDDACQVWFNNLEVAGKSQIAGLDLHEGDMANPKEDVAVTRKVSRTIGILLSASASAPLLGLLLLSELAWRLGPAPLVFE